MASSFLTWPYKHYLFVVVLFCGWKGVFVGDGTVERCMMIISPVCLFTPVFVCCTVPVSRSHAQAIFLCAQFEPFENLLLLLANICHSAWQRLTVRPLSRRLNNLNLLSVSVCVCVCLGKCHLHTLFIQLCFFVAVIVVFS